MTYITGGKDLLTHIKIRPLTMKSGCCTHGSSTINFVIFSSISICTINFGSFNVNPKITFVACNQVHISSVNPPISNGNVLIVGVVREVNIV